jgi:hypothetical protein
MFYQLLSWTLKVFNIYSCENSMHAQTQKFTKFKFKNQNLSLPLCAKMGANNNAENMKAAEL